jgi:beta-phosphoglucomutase family hydrolase
VPVLRFRDNRFLTGAARIGSANATRRADEGVTLPRGVIFDMDGVLVASGPAHRQSWRMLARKRGIEMSDEAFVESFGRTSRDIIRSLWGEGLSDEQVEQIDAEKEALYRELITGMVPLTIGTREVLSGLRAAGYVLAVATSGTPENVEMVLNEGRLQDYFAATATGFEVQHGKPAPDIFLLAAQRAGLQPEDAVVVEDAPVGIQAGRAAGMKIIGFVGTHPAERLREAGADRVAERLSEITPGLVDELLSD